MNIFRTTEEITALGEFITNNSLVKGDCLEVMNYIKPKSIDLICADLPYKMTHAKWDIPIPFPELWEHYNRIIKDNGTILLFGKVPFSILVGNSNLKMLKEELIWEKTQASGYFNAKRQHMGAHESIMRFALNPGTYNPQKTTGHKPINSYTKRADVCNKTEVYGKVKEDISGGGETDRYPRSVLKFASDKQKTKLDGTIHPTQKPLALIEYFIKTYTNEGDLCLDNVCGSGTLGLAAHNTKRNYIMIEKEQEWFDVTIKRINLYAK